MSLLFFGTFGFHIVFRKNMWATKIEENMNGLNREAWTKRMVAAVKTQVKLNNLNCVFDFIFFYVTIKNIQKRKIESNGIYVRVFWNYSI